MAYKINVDHLVTHELEHELKYRGIPVPPAAVDRRKILRGILSQEHTGRSSVTYVDNLKFTEEQSGIAESFKDFSKKI